jgi:hypothetical protein
MDAVKVEFFKLERNGRRSVGWEAVRGKRTRIPGTVMAAQRNLPHDLLQFVVEAACGIEDGFWGLLARGATFKSTGRKATRPGRALIAAHRSGLVKAEALVGLHSRAWIAGEHSPVTEALDQTRDRWDHLGQESRLVFEWPSPVGTVRTGVRRKPTFGDPSR